METQFYKQRKNRLLAGVVAGLADKYGWDLLVARILIGVLMYASGFGVIIYILLAIFLPYKEDVIARRHGNDSRRRKDADPVNGDDGWFW
ncbi:PspC domain-containing protein [Streptococcus iniae]